MVFIESPAEMNPEEQSKFIAGTQWDSNAVYFSAESPRKFPLVSIESPSEMNSEEQSKFIAGTQWDRAVTAWYQWYPLSHPLR